MPEGIEQILHQISQLPIKETLAVLAAGGIREFSRKGYEKLKNAIRNKFNESKFAFVPDKGEANKLKQFGGNALYKEILLLMPKYRYIDIIRTGLLIDYYHRNGNEKNRNRVKAIKEHILNMPNGRKLLKIANLPTTPFFSVVMQFLYDKRKYENYSLKLLEERFDEIIEDWEKSSLFVTSAETTKNILKFCSRHIEDGNKVFFILGMKQAAAVAESAVEELIRTDYLKNKGYKHQIVKRAEGNNPRAEITIFKE